MKIVKENLLLAFLIGFLLLIPLSRNILFKIALKNKKNEERKIIDGEIINKDKDEL